MMRDRSGVFAHQYCADCLIKLLDYGQTERRDVIS